VSGERGRESKKKKGEESTNAPVTSMDRHASTRGAEKERKGDKEAQRKTAQEGSTSAPVTSMDRHTSTKKGGREGGVTGSQQQSKKGRKKRCNEHSGSHVDRAETKNPQEERKEDPQHGKGGYKCTCHVYGQTHGYRENKARKEEEKVQCTGKWQ